MTLRALIVEEDLDDQATVRGVVTDLGHEAIIFAGPDFCQAFQGQLKKCPLAKPCYDVQILNNVLSPEVSGLEFITWQRRCGCKIPPENYAVLSDSWSVGELALAGEIGVRTFTKPFLVKDLVDWIYRIKHAFSK